MDSATNLGTSSGEKLCLNAGPRRADPDLLPRRSRGSPAWIYLDLIDGAARADRPELAFFDLESQNIKQTSDTIIERLQERLLLQRRDIKVEAQEVDQVSVAQPLLLDQSAPGGVGIFAQEPHQQIA